MSEIQAENGFIVDVSVTDNVSLPPINLVIKDTGDLIRARLTEAQAIELRDALIDAIDTARHDPRRHVWDSK